MGYKDLASISLVQVIGTGITAIFWFYIANFMNPEEYGKIFFFIGMASMVSSFALVGTQNSLVVYIAKKIPIQSTLFSISLIAGVIGSLIIFVMYRSLDTSLLVIAYIINTLAMGELLGKKDYSKFSIYFIIQKIGTILLGLLFLYFFGANGIIFALVLSYIAYVIPTIIGFRESKINLSLLKSRWRFILNNYLMSVIAGLNGQVDKIIIPTVMSFTILGNYSLSMQILAALMIFPNVVFRYLLPQDASGIKNKKLKIMTIIIALVITILGIIIIPIGIQNFFPQYDDAIVAIQIMIISVTPWTINLIYTSELLAREKSQYVLVSYSIITATIAIGIIVLGGAYGITGAAISQVLGQIFGAAFLIIKIKK